MSTNNEKETPRTVETGFWVKLSRSKDRARTEKTNIVKFASVLRQALALSGFDYIEAESMSQQAMHPCGRSEYFSAPGELT